MTPLNGLWKSYRRYLESCGCSQGFIYWKGVLVKELENFLTAEYGNDLFSLKRAEPFLQKRFGEYEMAVAGKKSFRIESFQTLLKDLNNLAEGRTPTGQLSGKARLPLNNELRTLYYEFRAYLETEEISDVHLEDLVTYTEDFLSFLSVKKLTDMKDFSFDLYQKYIQTKTGWKPKTMEHAVTAIRRLLRYLKEYKEVSFPFYEMIKSKQKPRRANIPTVWTEEEIQRFFKAIDRNNPIGKRDYALFLTSYLLGIRPGDVVRLRLRDIDWEKKRLDFVQNKTKIKNSLPIPDVLGDALVDYLTNARPDYFESDWIFLSHTPPFGPLKTTLLTTHFHQYRTKAGLHKDSSFCGPYSLRHTTASMLLKEGAPLPVITNILGHASVDTTKQYLKVDIEGLRQCVLDLDELLKED